MGTEADTRILPLFFKNDSIIPKGSKQDQIRPYEVCNAVAQVIGSVSVDGAQQIRNLWRIYIKSNEARIKLLTEGLTIRQKFLQLYDKNPYTTRNTEDGNPTVRITVADIPLSFDNESIAEHLKTEFNVELVSDMNYEYERTKEGLLTHYKNGNRFVFVKGPLENPLPRNGTIGNFQCKFFHRDQFKDTVCEICKKKGHKPGSKYCEFVMEEQKQRNVKGYDDILSSFFPCPIEMYGRSFKSAEHAFQYRCAYEREENELAEEIINSKHAGIAKKLGKRLHSEVSVTNYEVEIMENVLIEKAEQIAEFKDALKKTGSVSLVHAVSDKNWGTGLSPYLTKVIMPHARPGKNLFGQMLEKVRHMYIPDPSPSQRHSPERKNTVQLMESDRRYSNRYGILEHIREEDEVEFVNSSRKRDRINVSGSSYTSPGQPVKMQRNKGSLYESTV